MWVDTSGQPTTVDPSGIMSINELLRHSEITPESNMFESGFWDLLNVQNVYMRCSNLGHYNSLGVKGRERDYPKNKYQVVLVILFLIL